MNKNVLTLIVLPFLLSGCTVGSMISGHTGHLGDDYPDIRSVPEREEAEMSRGIHERDEEIGSAIDFEKLEQNRLELQLRNKSLRESAFPKGEQ